MSLCTDTIPRNLLAPKPVLILRDVYPLGEICWIKGPVTDFSSPEVASSVSVSIDFAHNVRNKTQISKIYFAT